MVILLTGATGFLGSNILKMLLQKNHTVIILKRSFSHLSRIDEQSKQIISYDADKLPSFEPIFKDNKIDVVIHCATDYGRKSTDLSQPVHANLILPLQLIQLGKLYNIKAFINTDTILDKRVNTYSLSKKQFIEWMDLYAQDMICINLALEHFYGPMDDHSKFLSFIIQNLINNVPEIHLTLGEQKRDFIHIDDVVSAFSFILKNLNNYQLGHIQHFEIGSGCNITIKELVMTIKKIAGNTHSQLLFGALPYRENEIMCSKVDILNITALGWKPTISLLDGLERTIAIEKTKARAI